MRTLDVNAGHVPGLLNRRNWIDASISNSRKQDAVSLVWFGTVDERALPHAIAINDPRFVELAALLTTHSEILSPLTGFVRLIPRSDLPELRDKIEGRSSQGHDVQSCVGVTIAEALLQRGLADSSYDVPLSACVKTLSWTLGRHYLQGGRASAVDVAARWAGVWGILREDEMNVEPGDALEVWEALFEPSGDARLPLTAQVDGSVVLDIVRRTGGQIDEIWRRLSDVSSIAKSFRLSQTQSREDRFQMLNRAMHELTSTGRLGEPFGRAVLGIYAAACVDFSLAGVTLLPSAAPKVSRLWAGLFAGAVRSAMPIRDGSGLDNKVEVLFEAESGVSARTSADIAFEEMVMLRRAMPGRLPELRQRALGEMAVELIPGLVATFSTNGKRSPRRREGARSREREVGELLSQVERSAEGLRRLLLLD